MIGEILVTLFFILLIVDKILDIKEISDLESENFELKIKTSQQEFEIESLKIRQNR